ncbi:hypothetical protein EVAR_82557_1 [Eumeta japonica]|uniref:Uncharacterized protein n=1 Tax=Eumeta variegata TaxID=151549 RepID=A0A4C1UWJ7_EUMVA|nr:hypothetical protein EVAR_82557_1 [Eumeta japonica]
MARTALTHRNGAGAGRTQFFVRDARRRTYKPLAPLVQLFSLSICDDSLILFHTKNRLDVEVTAGANDPRRAPGQLVRLSLGLKLD